MKRASLLKAWVGESDLSSKEQFKLAVWLTGIEESLAWHAGVCLDCLDLRRDEQGWKLRVQGRRSLGKKKAQNVVAWVHTETLYDCLWLFASQVKHAEVKWRTDKYPVFDQTPDR